MVLIDQIPWGEMDVDGSLICQVQEPYWRNVENDLRMTIYKWEHMPVDMVVTAEQTLPMVTEITPGQQRVPDPSRPSLILRRAGDKRLWDIARENGSTVEAIRKANGLQGEPIPDQMLLIPVS